MAREDSSRRAVRSSDKGQAIPHTHPRKNIRLVQLAYASACVGRLQLDTIKSILRKAVETNRKLGITGFLCFDHKSFLQILEGEMRAVNRVYNRSVN